MKKILILFILTISCSKAKKYENFDFITPFEASKGLETATYPQVIEFYKALAETYNEISIDSLGQTDSGHPLHYVTFHGNGSTANFELLREDHAILMINNGIHPGESDGIDATMMLYRDLANGTLTAPSHTVLVTIPVYNVGGSLNRNSGTRTNQNGPLSYGFRGNAQNYDLNRDFIKADTKNSKAFAKIFHQIIPDVFIDNHVSNGADYQYTLTHLFTQHNKLGGPQGDYLHQSLMPRLEKELSEIQWDITPYVNVFNRLPETGFSQFMDHPRYSTGYTTLFNTLGMMLETHMLKPYKSRVEGTYQFMNTMLNIVEKDHENIRSLKEKQRAFWQSATHYPFQWSLDTTKSTTIHFKGYEGTFKESPLTGAKRLKYDTSGPFTKPISYSNYYIANDSIAIPKGYVIPKGWHSVIDRLTENQIQLQPFEQDTILVVEQYKIENYKTRNRTYEGHYPHFATEVSSKELRVKFRKGDFYVPTEQDGIRYLLETLEPVTIDSFFNWNYFDTILQQKEGFSPYVWEDKAIELLQKHPQIQIDFNLKKTFDKEFANNWYAQLDWLHKQSAHYETAHLSYPIYRVTK